MQAAAHLFDLIQLHEAVGLGALLQQQSAKPSLQVEDTEDARTDGNTDGQLDTMNGTS